MKTETEDKDIKGDAPERDTSPRNREMTETETAIHEEARRRTAYTVAREREERRMCREDRRFYSVAGAMWDGSLGDQFENKIRLEVNKVALSMMKIFSAFRKNPITAKFISRDGQDADDLADICAGLFRSDEQDSTAQEAYDTAFEEGTAGGIGGWRLVTEWEDPEDDEDDNQRIRFEPVHDADQTMFFGPSKRQNKSDAQWATLLTPWDRDEYKDEYGEDPSSWPTECHKLGEFDWVLDNTVYVAEYFRIETEKRELIYFRDAQGEMIKHYAEDMSEAVELELAVSGAVEIRRRDVMKQIVMKYTLSGHKMIEKPQRIAGKHIPLIPFYGKRNVIDNLERYSGHVRLAKDPQRLKNMQVSRLAEIASKSTVEKPIFYPEQIEGHQDAWASDPVDDFAYLLINMIADNQGNAIPAAAAGKTSTPQIPTALGALLQMTDADIREILGNKEGGEEIVSNIGGDAVEAIHARLDMQDFIYISNMSKAVAWSACVWLEMAKEVYSDEGRVMKTVTSAEDEETGSASVVMGMKDTDIKKAKYSVTATVAPASSSRKTAVVRNMMNMMKVTDDPEAQLVLSLTAMMNAEGEGTTGARKYARKRLVGMGVVEPTDEERAEMEEAAQQEQQPDPATEIAKAEVLKAGAQVKEAEARERTANADVAKKQAEVAKMLAEMEPEDRALFLEMLDQLQNDQAAAVAPPQLEQQPELTQDAPAV